MANGTDLNEIGIRLLDDAYLGWCAAENESERALRGWLEAGTHEGAAAYCCYRAALDREEAAARDLQRLYELTTPCRLSLEGREQTVPSGDHEPRDPP